MGDDRYPTPWSSLKYDMRRDGYVAGITADQLNSARNTTTITAGVVARERSAHLRFCLRKRTAKF
jgi:hypothetical protein